MRSSPGQSVLDEQAVFMLSNSDNQPRIDLETVTVKSWQTTYVNSAVPAESVVNKNTQQWIEGKELILHKSLLYAHIFEYYPLWLFSLLQVEVVFIRLPQFTGWDQLRQFLMDNQDQGGLVEIL